MHGQSFAGHGIGNGMNIGVETLQVQNATVDVGGEVDIFIEGRAKLFHQRHGIGHYWQGGVGEVVQLHELIAETVVLGVINLVQKTGTFERANMIEQGGFWYFQHAVELG